MAHQGFKLGSLILNSDFSLYSICVHSDSLCNRIYKAMKKDIQENMDKWEQFIF